MNKTRQTDKSALHYANLAKKHIEYLAGSIGPRPSCQVEEAQAAQYAIEQLRAYGISKVFQQDFLGAPSAYQRYTLAMTLAALCGLLLSLTGSPIAAVAVMLASALGFSGIILESDFRSNWTRGIIRSRPSQNVIAKIEPSYQDLRDIVLVAHLDTHRTPWFNAFHIGQRLFRASFMTVLFLNSVGFLIGAVFLIAPSNSLRWTAACLSGFLLLIGLFFLQADFTSYSPGAYDNASGVGSVLALAARSRLTPLQHISLWVALTGCEETGSAGMQAFLKEFAARWRDPLIINLDQMGSERLYLRTREGLVLRRFADPDAIRLANNAAHLAGINVIERASQAYSDAAVAMQHHLPSISLGTQPSDPEEMTHRHRMTDRPEHIQWEGLHQIQSLTWTLLRHADELARPGG